MFPVLAGNSASTGYNLTRSLRLRNSASAYLNRTPASATNRQTWTWSAWVKLTPYNPAVGGYDSWLLTTKFNGVAPTATTISINTNYKLVFASYDGSGGSPSLNLVTAQVFRDYSSWYHIVVVADTTQATAANRAKMYVNGVQITSFSTATYPAQNYNTYINNNDVTALGALYYSGGAAYSYLQFLDSYMAEMNFIDGQALTPSSFGSTNTLTGVWQPARYAGTYGTNGFYLPFTDNSALTTSSNVGLGKDFSGNGNYWTTNNISITAGVTYDSMTDVPTLTSATAANYCVMNPLFKSTRINGLSNGNLRITGIAGGNFYGGYTGTMFAPSGKFYWEVTAIQLYTTNSYFAGGIATNNYLSTESNGAIVACPGGTTAGAGTGMNFYPGNTGSELSLNGSTSSLSASYAVGDVMNFALDAATGKFWIGKNGTWLSSGNPSAGTNQIGTITGGTSYAPWFGCYTDSDIWAINLGQRPFTYTPPTGFVALNTYNLPTSTILQGNKVMDATLYTGNGSTQTITNAAAFKPDLVWQKSRSNAISHILNDSVRGVSKTIYSNLTNAEASYPGYNVTAFNSNGFSVGDDSAGAYGSNGTGQTYVGWQWQAGQGTTSSNTNGTITSTVSVNASAGFSVVTYTGTGANGATVGHGLGVAPSLMIIKARSLVSNWGVYHASVGNTAALSLETTSAISTSVLWWNNTSPTSSVFSLGTIAALNTNGTTHVAYCWTPIAGYSAFGRYTGNGSNDGPMVYTGFQPKYLMIKRTDSTGDWTIWDAARDPYNVVGNALYADLSNAEATGNSAFDFLSNGFKIRNSFANINASGGTYIYMAFATTPFKNSLAR